MGGGVFRVLQVLVAGVVGRTSTGGGGSGSLGELVIEIFSVVLEVYHSVVLRFCYI